MRRTLRTLPFLCLTLAGCNAPMAAFMDSCFPSRAKSNPGPDAKGGPGVDVRPNPNPDPIKPAPNPNPGPLPPPDFGQ